MNLRDEDTAESDRIERKKSGDDPIITIHDPVTGKTTVMRAVGTSQIIAYTREIEVDRPKWTQRAQTIRLILTVAYGMLLALGAFALGVIYHTDVMGACK